MIVILQNINFAHLYLVILRGKSELTGINNCESQNCEINCQNYLYLLLILWQKKGFILNSSEMTWNNNTKKKKSCLYEQSPKKQTNKKKKRRRKLIDETIFFQTPSVTVERALSGLHTRWIEEDSGKWQRNPVQPSAKISHFL